MNQSRHALPLFWWLAALIFFLLIIVPVTVSLFGLTPHLNDCKAIGVDDFLQYWSGFHLLRMGENPYDPNLLFQLQGKVGCLEKGVSMPWIPPWGFLLLSPVLWSSYGSSVVSWLIIQVSGFSLLGYFFFRANGTSRAQALLGALASAAFLPSLAGYFKGQMSLYLALGSVLFFWGYRTRNVALLVCSLALFFVKPHLFILLIIPALFQIRYERDWLLIKVSMVTLFMLLAFSMLVRESFVVDWFHLLIAGDVSSVSTPLSRWQGSTLSMGMRQVFSLFWGVEPGWSLSVAILFISLFGVGWWIDKSPNVLVKRNFSAVILALSVFVAPYGWFFDQVLLLPLYLEGFCVVLNQVPRNKRVRTAGVIIIGQILLSSFFGYIGIERGVFVLYPILIISFEGYARRSSNSG